MSAKKPDIEKKEKKTETCIISGCDIGDLSHTGVRCASGHHVCEDCSSHFVAHVLEDIGTRYHCTAVGCKAELVPLTFERQLKPPQLVGWAAFSALKGKNVAKLGEAIYTCPVAACQEDAGGWFCIMDAIMPRTYFDCSKCAGRGRNGATCTYCKEVLMVPTGEETPRTYDTQLNSRVRHFGGGFGEGGGGGGGEEEVDFCEALGPHMQVFLKVIADSLQPCCPHCGHRGRKDDACTHMTCPSCANRWCYCCGKKAEEADGSGPHMVRGVVCVAQPWLNSLQALNPPPPFPPHPFTQDFGEHNVHFDSSDPEFSLRCPQFFDDADVVCEDPEWAGVTGDDATDKYHQWSLRRDVAAWYKTLGRFTPPELTERPGMDLYDRLAAHFPAVRACGIAKADFVHFDPATTPLYRRNA